MSPAATPQPAASRPRATTDQERARWAWERIQNDGVDSDYVGLVKAAPIMIMGSGLIQTIAFLADKGKSHHLKLLQQLCDKLGLRQPSAAAVGELVALVSSASYRAKTEEALALLRWLRHLAAVVQKGEKQ